MQTKGKGFALLPLLVFLVLFIGTGAYLTYKKIDMPFYQLSAAVAVLPAIILALIQGDGSTSNKMARFIKGVGESNIITMCIIYLLAGAFTSVATAIGGVSASVNFGLSFIPLNFILPGLFVTGAFISTAMGTSMGTVAAIAPIALGIAEQTNIGLPILMGVVLSGAMFGDNLSLISDTTIAATRTQGCQMRDKFIMNLYIVMPAALATLLFFYFIGSSGVGVRVESFEFIKVLPYISILLLALLGINVFVVLICGIIFSGIVGMITMENYNLLIFSNDIYKGFANMNEIMILSMMLGGLGELIKSNGGIAWLLEKMDLMAKVHIKEKKSKISPDTSPDAPNEAFDKTSPLEHYKDSEKIAEKKRSFGEWSIAALVGFADICVANNTVAIILTGNVAKEIAEKNGVDPRRAASILDMVSCIFQGILPYAAQVLLAGSIAKISPIEVGINNYYCMALAIAVIIAITFKIPKVKKTSKK